MRNAHGFGAALALRDVVYPGNQVAFMPPVPRAPSSVSTVSGAPPLVTNGLVVLHPALCTNTLQEIQPVGWVAPELRRRALQDGFGVLCSNSARRRLENTVRPSSVDGHPGGAVFQYLAQTLLTLAQLVFHALLRAAMSSYTHTAARACPGN